MAQFEKLTAPTQGTPIRFENGQPVVADNPIIPFIRGDGTGVDIWPATQKVLDAAVAKAYGGSKNIEWFKVVTCINAKAGMRVFDVHLVELQTPPSQYITIHKDQPHRPELDWFQPTPSPKDTP